MTLKKTWQTTGFATFFVMFVPNGNTWYCIFSKFAAFLYNVFDLDIVKTADKDNISAFFALVKRGF